MQDAINYHLLPLDFKQDSVVACSQAIFGCEVCQLFYVTRETVLKTFDFGQDRSSITLR